MGAVREGIKYKRNIFFTFFLEALVREDRGFLYNPPLKCFVSSCTAKESPFKYLFVVATSLCLA